MFAIDQVLNTAELVEHIILQDISFFDIVRCQRVCHFLKAVIDNSKPIRRILFLEPETAHENVGACVDLQLVATKIHPALQTNRVETFGAFFVHVPESRAMLKSLGSSLICQPPTKNIVVFSQPRRHVMGRGDKVLQGDTIAAFMEVVNEIDRDGRLLYCITICGRTDERSCLAFHSRQLETKADKAKLESKASSNGGKAYWEMESDTEEGDVADWDEATDNDPDEQDLANDE